jgi:O-antigen/teichoic acid export membrane protein
MARLDESLAAASVPAGEETIFSWLKRPRQGLAADAAGTALLNVATVALNFAITVVLTRTLGAGGYGAYAFGLAWAVVLSAPANLGLTPLVVRSIVEYRTRSNWALLRGLLRRANQVVLATSVALAAGAAIVGIFVVPDGQLRRPLFVALLLVPVTALISLRQAAMQGFHRVVVGRTPETVIAPLAFLGSLGVIGLGAGSRLTPAVALALNVTALLIAFGAGAWLLRRTLPRAVRSATPEYETGSWVRSGLPLLLLSCVLAVNAQVGVIAVGSLAGTADAGVYSVANRAANLISFLLIATSYPLMPLVSRLHAEGDLIRLQQVATRAVRVLVLCCFPVALVLAVFATPILSLFGSGFEGGATALRICSIGELVNVTTGFAGTILVMTGHEKRLAKGAIGGALANVVLSFALAPFWGASGAAIGLVAGMTLSNTYLALHCWRDVRIVAPLFSLRRLFGFDPRQAE